MTPPLIILAPIICLARICPLCFASHPSISQGRYHHCIHHSHFCALCQFFLYQSNTVHPIAPIIFDPILILSYAPPPRSYTHHPSSLHKDTKVLHLLHLLHTLINYFNITSLLFSLILITLIFLPVCFHSPLLQCIIQPL